MNRRNHSEVSRTKIAIRTDGISDPLHTAATAVEISSEPASNDAASEEQATEPEQVPEAVVTEDAGPASGSDPTDNTDPDVSDDPQIDDTADSAPDADEPASTQEENTTTPEDPAPEPEPETAAGKVPELRVEYTQPLADSQITDQTPLRAGIMRAPRLRAPAVSSGSISNFNAEVFYGGVWDDIDTDGDGQVDRENQYVWRAQSSAANHHFNFRISFTLGNDGSLGVYKGSVDGGAAGVHITVPKTILQTRTGAQGDYLEMSIPSREDVLESIEAGEQLDSDMSFAWYEEGDHIVLYNYRDIDPGFDAFIELSYVTNSVTFDYVDMTKSDIFQTTIEAVLTDADGNKKSPDKADNEAGPVWIDTQVELLSTESRIPVKYDTWPWGDPPANYPDKVQDKDGNWVDFDPDDYVYFVWEIRSRINDNSQMYDFTIEDVLSNLKCSQNGKDTTKEIPEGSAFPVAIKFSGQSGYEVGSKATIEGQTLTGLRYDYVLTAFRKDFWNEQTHWEMTNDSTVTVHPYDNLDPDSSATFRRNFYWNKPIYQGGGPGNFGAWKRADGYYRYRADRNEWPRTLLSELGMVAGDYSRYDLGDLIEGKVDHLDNLDYAVGAEGVALRWTLKRDYNQSIDGEQYDNYYVEPVKYVVIDDEFYVFDEQDGIPNADQKPDARLTYEDFQIDTIALNITCYDRAYNSSTAAFDTAKTTTYLKNKQIDGVDGGYDETITVYGKFGTSEEWVWLADYDVATRKITDTNSNYVKGNTNSKLTLVDNCVGYKLETYNTHYYSRIGSVPNIRIKDSDKITSALQNEAIGINNVMRAQLFDYKSAYGASTAADRDSLSTEPYTHIVFNSSDNDTDYVRTVEKDVELNKNVVATANVPKKKQYVITWKIDMKETYTTDAQGTRAPIEQNGGVFYDLLPDGATLDPASVLVVTEDGDLRVNAYTVEQQQNYQGTGRSLLIVKIKEPADWYEVYYDTIHPYESIRDYGNLVYNPVAYETGNPDITSGVTNDATDKPLADDPTKQIRQADLMTKLPSDATGKQFIYTEREYDIAAITAASSGLSKKVLTANSSAYGNDGITPNGKIYSYRLRFQNSFANKAKDLIFFDSLENYVANDRSSDWQGTLQSVDLKLLREKGIDPKVYISTVENLNIEYHNDLSETSIWTFVDPDKDDLSEARAIAIDMRKKDDGTDFVLEEGGTLTAYLYLRAPQGAERLDDTEGYPETYNNIYISRIILTETETAAPNLTHQDYTTVGLVITGDVNLRKISSTDREGIRDISFRLRGTSYYGTPIDLFQSSDRNGYLTFKDVEMGTYILSEYEATPDWLEDHTEHTVQITALGKVLIDGTDYTDDTIEIENDPRIHADLLFLKRQAVIEGDDSKPVIPDTTFELSGTSDYGNDISIIATSNVLGIVALRDVEKGTYILKEIKANDDYVLSDAEYRVVVDGDGNITVTEKKEVFGSTVLMPVDQDGIYPVIYNNPRYWDFSFRKVDAENITRWLEGATFTLTGANISEQPVKLDENGDPVLDEDGNTIPDGDPVNYLTATSDKNGKVTFSHLEAGSYILKETQAPTGLDGTGKKTDGGTLNYLADSAEYIVVVSEDGTITIDGLTKNSLGEYMVKNGRSLDGEIIVYKKWEDLDASQRKNPVVHLVPDPDSLTIHGITVTKEWVGDYPEARPEDVTIALQKIPVTVGQGYTVTGPTPSDTSSQTTFSEAGEWKKNGNTWTYTFDVEVDGKSQYYVYETEDPNNYTGSATGEKNKVPVNGGKATITNTYKGLIMNFDYTGGVQEWTAPVSGYYQLETWGASGAKDASNQGGRGGYSKGAVYLNKGDVLYVIVGGQGRNGAGTAGGYNGGGQSGTSGSSGSGGGMTHISTTINPAINRTDGWDPTGTLIVAGGGGGAGLRDIKGGHGGGKSGGDGYGAATGGTQSDGYAQGFGQNRNDSGVGTDGGGGGAGWYGGKAAQGDYGAGGGSGYISPELENAETIAGNLTFKAPDGKDEIGHFGNGYARITFISHDNPAPPSQTDTTIPETPTLPSTEYISNGEWEKIDDDTWRYVFHVFNDDAEFTYWEERIEGYNSASYDRATFDGSTQKSVVITNTSTAAYGSLTVTKTVEGLENSTQKFDFTVTLTGAHITNPGTQVIDGIVFTNGVATFSLADGESKTISNIPAGTTYTVTEAENENFTVTYTDNTGLIAANETKTATVTNTYKPPEINPVDVTLKKVVTGNVSGTEGDEYTFFASFENLAGEMEYVVSDGTNEITRFTSDKDGKASVSLKLQADGIAIFKDIPVGATYRIMEDAGDYVSSFFISGTGGSIIQTAGENTQKQQSLSTATEMAEEGESVTVTFSNRLENTQTLTVRKLVDKQGYNVEDEAFEVTVTFTGLAPFGTITSSIGRWVADDMGQVEKTFTLKDGESIVFSDVPVGVHYTVTEAKNRYVASYEITADDEFHACFVNDGRGGNTAPNTKLTTAEETVDRYENATVTLVNTLTTADLSIGKTVSGNMGNKTRSFAFTVTIPEMANQTVTPKDKDGNALPKVTFDEKGVITVHLKHGETITIPGVPVGASYTVKEDNGLYTATYQVSGGAKQNGAEVTGTMPATGLEVAYNNELNVAVPTGADSIPYTALALLAILPAGAILLRRRRQKKEMRG